MDYCKNFKYKVLTPSGFQFFAGIKKVVKPFYFKISFIEIDKQVGASEHHKFWSENQDWIEVCNLKTGQRIVGKDQLYTVKSVEKVNEEIVLYDLVEVDGGHKYFTDNLFFKYSLKLISSQ